MAYLQKDCRESGHRRPTSYIPLRVNLHDSVLGIIILFIEVVIM